MGFAVRARVPLPDFSFVPCNSNSANKCLVHIANVDQGGYLDANQLEFLKAEIGKYPNLDWNAAIHSDGSAGSQLQKLVTQGNVSLPAALQSRLNYFANTKSLLSPAENAEKMQVYVEAMKAYKQRNPEFRISLSVTPDQKQRVDNFVKSYRAARDARQLERCNWKGEVQIFNNKCGGEISRVCVGRNGIGRSSLNRSENSVC